MATSPLLQLTLQEFNTNANSWGEILNDSALQLLEDAVAGAVTITLIGEANKTLTDLAGQTTESRYAILDIGGTSATPTATNVVVPTRSKIYLAVNGADNPVVVKTAAGTGPEIPVGEAQWVFCDGVNVLAASVATATSAGTATTADDSLALIGVAGANFAQKITAGSFTAGQVVVRDDTYTPLTGATLQINCALSNSFYVLVENSFTLQAPTNASDGQQFTLALQQGAGGPHTITFASSTFCTAGGTAITLSTGLGDIDYLGFERIAPTGGLASPFNTGDSTRWVVSVLKELGDI